MKKYGIGLIIVVVLVVGVFISSHNTKDDSSDTISIGAVLPLTDFGAFWGVSTKAGMDLALEDLRSEGFNVDIIFEDSVGKPDVAASVAQKLIAIDKVDMLFADLTGPSNAVSPVAEAAGKVMAYSAFDPAIASKNPLAIKTFMDAVDQCGRFAQYSKDELGITKIAYVGVNLSFATPCVDELKKVFGEENVFVEAVASPAESDFRSSLVKVQNAGAEFIVSYGYEVTYEAIMRQRLEMGTMIPVFCVISDCHTDKIAKEIPLESLNGSILFDYSVEPSFHARIFDVYGSEVNSRSAAVGYDIVQYLVRSSSECEDHADASCVLEHLDTVGYVPKVSGTGFGGDRVFDVKASYFLVKDGEKVEIGL
jgi:branched-chain amino acid transport system substrate-binding protein